MFTVYSLISCHARTFISIQSNRRQALKIFRLFLHSFHVSFRVIKNLGYCCSNSTTIEAGPYVSILYLVCLRPELWPTLCVAVQSKEPLEPSLCRVYQKRNGFEAKTLPVALESDESLLLKVEPVARLPKSKQKLT